MPERLIEIRARLRAGQIDKHQFIREMNPFHDVLFEYPAFMRETDIARIEISDEHVVLVCRDGTKFAWDPIDRYFPALGALGFGAYEPVDGAMIQRLVRPGVHVFDVGANVGWYTVRIARAQPTTKVFAFEPIPFSFSRLHQNIRLNKLDNATPFAFGLSDMSRDADFYFSPAISGAASESNILDLPAGDKVSCTLRRLDEVQEELGVPVDFIKCDVEGAELLVLRGALKSIRRFRPVIFCEMLRKWSATFNYHPNDIISMLAGEGYGCFEIDADRLRSFPRMAEDTMATNFVFLHSQVHRDILEQLV